MRPFKKWIRFRPLRGRLWGVCDTPLQLGTYDPSKYRCDSQTGYVRPYKKTIPFSSPSGPLVGRIQYAPTIGYVRPFEKLFRFRPLRGRLWGVFNTPLQSGMCDSSKYRCDSPTGYVQSFEIPIRSLDRRGGGVWEVGRWGLPLAGEAGVNEFGEEEDNDQDDNNEGARGDL